MKLRKLVSKKEFEEIKQSVIKALQQYQLIKSTDYFNQLPENGDNPEDIDTATKSLLDYCVLVERALMILTPRERTIIEGRYFTHDAEYISDQEFYHNRLDPPISGPTYTKVRDQIFMKLAPYLDGESFRLKIEYKHQIMRT